MSGTAHANGAHRRYNAVYLSELRLSGARCFGPEQRLSLTAGGRPAKWTVLLGENGVGKTTLLQCAWMMAPSVSEPRAGALAGSNPRGLTSSRGPALQRTPSSPLSIHADIVVDQPLASGEGGRTAHLWLQTLGATTSARGLPDAHANAVCCGYGALRRWAEAQVEAGIPSDAAASLFSDDAALISGSEWLLRADYAAKTTADARAATRSAQIRAALVALLPDVTDIRVAGLDEEPPRPRIDVQTPYGWVSMRSLSLGYRSMIAWVVDFASRMFEAYPDSADPLAEPAIALVDEIDLHLHPHWQREVTAHLDRLFPNVQFVVTAHSPLVVQGASVTNVAVLRRAGDHVEILNDPEQVRGWRVDQILTSDLFGLPSARPIEVEQLLARQEELVLLDDPTDSQRAELAEVDARLAEITPGETAKDRETWAIVRRLADQLASGAGPQR